MIFALWILIISTIIVLFCGFLYLATKGRLFKIWYHDFVGWHLPKEDDIKTDGFIVVSHCKFCGKEIMQDSQGNWF